MKNVTCQSRLSPPVFNIWKEGKNEKHEILIHHQEKEHCRAVQSEGGRNIEIRKKNMTKEERRNRLGRRTRYLPFVLFFFCNNYLFFFVKIVICINSSRAIPRTKFFSS